MRSSNTTLPLDSNKPIGSAKHGEPTKINMESFQAAWRLVPLNSRRSHRGNSVGASRCCPPWGTKTYYDRFDFGQAWDSPHNLEIARQIPESFPLANREGQSRWILAICELGLYGPDRTQPSLADVSDRKIWTAAVLERQQVAKSSDGPARTGDGLENGLTNGVEAMSSGVMMITVDGQSRIVRKNQTALRAVLTRSGGETMSRKDFFPLQANQRLGMTRRRLTSNRPVAQSSTLASELTA